MPDHIEKTTTLKAPVDRVWEAITDHEKFGEWFRVKLYDPFREGEITKGHITYPGYEHFEWESITRVIRPKSYFAFTWFHDDIQPHEGTGRLSTLVEFKLEPRNGGTHLTIIESGFDAFPPGAGKEAWKRNEGGWTEQVSNITAYVDG